MPWYYNTYTCGEVLTICFNSTWCTPKQIETRFTNWLYWRKQNNQIFFTQYFASVTRPLSVHNLCKVCYPSRHNNATEAVVHAGAGATGWTTATHLVATGGVNFIFVLLRFFLTITPWFCKWVSFSKVNDVLIFFSFVGLRCGIDMKYFDDQKNVFAITSKPF